VINIDKYICIRKTIEPLEERLAKTRRLQAEAQAKLDAKHRELETLQ
jgi:hypothetical protein